MIRMLKEAYPVQKACQLLDYPRSSYYYAPRVKEEDQRLKQAIQTVAGEWPTYGYCRIAAQLNRQGWQVNHTVSCAKWASRGSKKHKQRLRPTASTHTRATRTEGFPEKLRVAGKHAFVARVDPRTTFKMGEKVKVAFNMGNFHIFDPSKNPDNPVAVR